MPSGTLLMLLAAAVAAALGHLGAAAVRQLGSEGKLLDQPGPHRLHAHPIPRGGGIGICAALMFIGLAPVLASPQIDGWRASAAWLAAALAMVGGVGWLDDRRGLPAWPRLAIHLIAAACVAFAWSSNRPEELGFAWVGFSVVLLATTASINLHNFFDGANGLLATQVLFVASVIAVLAVRDSHMPLAILATATTGGLLGFLPHNFPYARVFLGDVGSGALGLVVAALGVLSIRDGLLAWPVFLLLVSGCLVDTGMTLASRALRGRRFWRRHHEHLYQWIVRSGWSHARTAGLWFLWNVVIVMPACLAAWATPRHAGWLAVIVYAFGMSIWLLAKHEIHARARSTP